MNVLCIICARGGSKGVPGKNIRSLAGKPLVVHTIETALAVDEFDNVICSSDDDEIRRIAQAAGADAPFRRPAEMATDEASKLPVLRHALQEAESRYGKSFDVIVDLQPNSPFTTVEDVRATLITLERTGADIAFTVCEAEGNPYFTLVELDPQGWARISKPSGELVQRRQDAPAVYRINGGVYAWRRATLLGPDMIFEGRCAIHVVPPERSVDIDVELDFLFAEFLMTRRPT